ncbi:pyridoxamine 5'-phosphate oxidase family protein [Mycobacterium sp. 050272]|uniref:pyridoxamine 5'-phosphate oxidase family protein n=1 Tax=Mycobacterium sp. 050272 TaxID=3142488 RepID=UPI003185C8AD
MESRVFDQFGDLTDTCAFRPAVPALDRPHGEQQVELQRHRFLTAAMAAPGLGIYIGRRPDVPGRDRDALDIVNHIAILDNIGLGVPVIADNTAQPNPGTDLSPMAASPDVTDFLCSHHRAFLFCRDAAGEPTGYAMRTVAYRGGELLFATYTKSAKVRNMRARPEVACLVQSGPEHTASWVSVRGRAAIYLPARDEVDALMTSASSDARVPDAVVATVRDRLISGKRCIIRVAVEKVVASNLAAAREFGGDGATP